MPLGCLIQDGDNDDCQEDDRGLRRGLKPLCEAKLLLKWTFRLCIKRFYWIRVEFKGARQNTRVLQWHHTTPLRSRGRRRCKKGTQGNWKGQENSLVTGELVYAVIYDVDLDALADKGSLIWEEERPKATSHHEDQTGFMLLMATIN